MPQSKQLLQVDSGLTPQEYRPTAQVVDTFARPDEGQDLAQVASALSAFAPALAQWGARRSERHNKEAVERGQQVARQLAEQRTQYGQAVKDGLIRPDENEWFQMGLREQTGRITAGQYSRDLRVALASDESIKDATDMNEFASFESKFREQWLKDNVGESRDLHFERGFGGLVDAYVNNVADGFTSTVEKNVEVKAGQQHYAELGDVLNEFGAKDRAAAIAQMNTINDSLLKLNPKAGTLANRMTIEAVIDYAVLNKDLGALDMLFQLRGGPGGTIGGLPAAKKAIAEARRDISRDLTQADNLAEVQEARKRREVADSVFTDLANAAEQARQAGTDPSQIDLGPMLQRFREQGMGAREQELFAMRAMYANVEDTGSMPLFTDALRRLDGLDGRPPLRLTDAIALTQGPAGKRLNAAQFTTLRNAIMQRDDRNTSLADRANAQEFSDQYTWMRSPWVRQFMEGTEKAYWDGTQKALAGQQFFTALVTDQNNLLRVLRSGDEAKIKEYFKQTQENVWASYTPVQRPSRIEATLNNMPQFGADGGVIPKVGLKPEVIQHIAMGIDRTKHAAAIKQLEQDIAAGNISAASMQWMKSVNFPPPNNPADLLAALAKTSK